MSQSCPVDSLRPDEDSRRRKWAAAWRCSTGGRHRCRTAARRRPRRAAASPEASAGQRGWNRQPAGTRVGSGGSPAARSARGGRSRARPRAAPGCRGAAGRQHVLGRSDSRRSGRGTSRRCRSAMFQARPRSWVTTSTESPRSSRSASSSARISPRTEASSEETGSSATSTSGSRTSAPAMTTRWRWPPDSSCGIAQEVALRRAQAGPRQRLGDQLPPRCRRPVDAQALGDRLVDGVPRVERAGRVLQHQLHLAAVGLQRRVRRSRSGSPS